MNKYIYLSLEDELKQTLTTPSLEMRNAGTLTDVISGGGIVSGVTDDAARWHRTDPNVIAATGLEVSDVEVKVTVTTTASATTSTTTWSHCLTLLDRMDTVIPTDFKASGAAVIFIHAPDDFDAVWSIGFHDDWWRWHGLYENKVHYYISKPHEKEASTPHHGQDDQNCGLL